MHQVHEPNLTEQIIPLLKASLPSTLSSLSDRDPLSQAEHAR